MMNLWATGKLSYYNEFWSVPAWSVGHLLFVTYFREFHFYWCHRMIHPWFKKRSQFKSLDVGQFLYNHFHSLHHKSNNPVRKTQTAVSHADRGVGCLAMDPSRFGAAQTLPHALPARPPTDTPRSQDIFY
eukprot:SAG22_NODE_88_length_21409_cov_11.207180_6_plen_130_part_00